MTENRAVVQHFSIQECDRSLSTVLVEQGYLYRLVSAREQVGVGFERHNARNRREYIQPACQAAI